MLVINNNLHFSLYNNMMLYTIYFIFLILQNCLAYFLAVQYGQKVFFIVFHTIMNIHTIFQRIIPFRMFFFYHNSWWPFSYGATSQSYILYIVHIQSCKQSEKWKYVVTRALDSCWPTSPQMDSAAEPRRQPPQSRLRTHTYTKQQDPNQKQKKCTGRPQLVQYLK